MKDAAFAEYKQEKGDREGVLFDLGQMSLDTKGGAFGGWDGGAGLLAR